MPETLIEPEIQEESTQEEIHSLNPDPNKMSKEEYFDEVRRNTAQNKIDGGDEYNRGN